MNIQYLDTIKLSQTVLQQLSTFSGEDCAIVRLGGIYFRNRNSKDPRPQYLTSFVGELRFSTIYGQLNPWSPRQNEFQLFYDQTFSPTHPTLSSKTRKNGEKVRNASVFLMGIGVTTLELAPGATSEAQFRHLFCEGALKGRQDLPEPSDIEDWRARVISTTVATCCKCKQTATVHCCLVLSVRLFPAFGIYTVLPRNGAVCKK